MNYDLLIEAAFSKMKNNLRFMDKSVSKRPRAACNQGGKKKYQEIPRFILVGGRQGKGGAWGKRAGKRIEGGIGIG